MTEYVIMSTYNKIQINTPTLLREATREDSSAHNGRFRGASGVDGSDGAPFERLSLVLRKCTNYSYN